MSRQARVKYFPGHMAQVQTCDDTCCGDEPTWESSFCLLAVGNYPDPHVDREPHASGTSSLWFAWLSEPTTTRRFLFFSASSAPM